MKADAFLNRSVLSTESEELQGIVRPNEGLEPKVTRAVPTSTTIRPPPSSGLLTPKAFVIVISLMTGLYSLCGLAAFMYQKEVLKLSPSTIQLLSGLLSIPWGFKFVFGYSYDAFVPVLGKSKHLIFIISALRIIIFGLIWALPLNTFWFFALMFLGTLCGLYENIAAECQLVVMTKEANLRDPTEKANHLPIFFGCRAAGQLIGGFFGGRLISRVSIQAPFLICAFLPLVTMAACLFYREPTIAPRLSRSFTQEWQVIKSIVVRDKVAPMLLFISLINATPNFDSVTTFYQTDFLHFTMDDLANFASFSTICYIAGLILYSLHFRKFDPHRFFLGTNFLLWAVNVSFLLVVLGLIAHWGLSVKTFCFLNFGTYSFVSEINFMPIIAIWCAICPPSLEATSITLLTAFINFSSNLGVYLGAFFMWILSVEAQQFDRLWILLVIQNAYLVLAIIGVLFVPFPDPSSQPPPFEHVPLATAETNDIEFAAAD
jgi:MFS family permease